MIRRQRIIPSCCNFKTALWWDLTISAYGQSSRLEREHKVHCIIMLLLPLLTGWLPSPQSTILVGYCRLCVRDQTICTLLFAKLWHCQCVVLPENSLRNGNAPTNTYYPHALRCTCNSTIKSTTNTFGDNFFFAVVAVHG